jgi:hypothetical protein
MGLLGYALTTGRGLTILVMVLLLHLLLELGHMSPANVPRFLRRWFIGEDARDKHHGQKLR